MSNTINLSTTHQTHDFLSRLNEQQKLDDEIYQFISSLEIKDSTLDKFRSKFIELYWNNNFYTPNKNSYLKLFVTLINYLQNAELGCHIKNISWFSDVIKQAKLNPINYSSNFEEFYEFTFLEYNKNLFNESTKNITLKLTLRVIDNHLYGIILQ
jgi:hypothetical protein